MKKNISITVMCMGLLLVLVGLFLKIPSKELTTFDWKSDSHSVIEKYVGGDAYNYIIGASIVSGEISAAKIQKAIFISFGILVFTMGLLAFSYLNCDKETIRTTDTISNIEENLPEI